MTDFYDYYYLDAETSQTMMVSVERDLFDEIVRCPHCCSLNISPDGKICESCGARLLDK